MSDSSIGPIERLRLSEQVALLNGLSFTALSTHRCKPLMAMTESLWAFPNYDFDPERIDEMLMAAFEHARCPTNPKRENGIAVFGYATTLIGSLWCKTCDLAPTQELMAIDTARVQNDLERCVDLSGVWPENHVANAVASLAATSGAPKSLPVSELRNTVIDLLSP